MIFDFVTGATTDNLPPGVLYQVKAAYKYQAEDMDELQFEVGEVIDVVEYEDPEEQVRLQSSHWLERFLDSLLFSGGGLADGGAFVNRAEGTLPGQLHETHLINTSSHLALQPSE